MHTTVYLIPKLMIPKFYKIVAPGHTKVTTCLNHSQFELKYKHLSIIAMSTKILKIYLNPFFKNQDFFKELQKVCRYVFFHKRSKSKKLRAGNLKIVRTL